MKSSIIKEQDQTVSSSEEAVSVSADAGVAEFACPPLNPFSCIYSSLFSFSFVCSATRVSSSCFCSSWLRVASSLFTFCRCSARIRFTAAMVSIFCFSSAISASFCSISVIPFTRAFSPPCCGTALRTGVSAAIAVLSFHKHFSNYRSCVCSIGLELMDACTQLRDLRVAPLCLLRLRACSCCRCSSAASLSPSAFLCSCEASHAALGCLFGERLQSAAASLLPSRAAATLSSAADSLWTDHGGLLRLKVCFLFCAAIWFSSSRDSIVETAFPWLRRAIASSFRSGAFIARIAVISSDYSSRVEGRCWYIEMFF